MQILPFANATIGDFGKLFSHELIEPFFDLDPKALYLISQKDPEFGNTRFIFFKNSQQYCFLSLTRPEEPEDHLSRAESSFEFSEHDFLFRYLQIQNLPPTVADIAEMIVSAVSNPKSANFFSPQMRIIFSEESALTTLSLELQKALGAEDLGKIECLPYLKEQNFTTVSLAKLKNKFLKKNF